MARSSSSLLRRTLWLLLLAVVIGLSVGGLLLSGYLIKLDEEIRSRFAGSRWALPAQVYAAAQDLYPGRNLSAADLRHELERLGYRPAGTLSGPGTFVAILFIVTRSISLQTSGTRTSTAHDPPTTVVACRGPC